MSKVIIVVEGKTDELILNAVSPRSLQRKIQFVVGSGRYSAQSIARTILAYERQPVALVLDADTTDESKVKEQVAYFQKALGEVASDIPYQAFIVVPEIEIILFENQTYLEKLAQRKISQEELDYAQTAPKKALESFLGGRSVSPMHAALKQLDDITLKSIHDHPLMKGLCNFVDLASHFAEREAIAA